MKFLFTLISTQLCLLLYAQSKEVELTIQPEKVEVGQKIVINISTQIQGDFIQDNLPDEFRQDMGYQQGQHSELDYNTGVSKTVYFYTLTGHMLDTGSFTFGPMFIRDNNKSYPSNRVTIKVTNPIKYSTGEISAAQLNEPAFGVISANKTEIYEGEPVLLAAKVYAIFRPDDIKNYDGYSTSQSVVKHPIGFQSNSVDLYEEKVKGKNFISFVYDRSVLFPTGVGNFMIQPFRLNLMKDFRYLPVTSSPLRINIKPLPSPTPANFIGGVGKFSMRRTIDTTTIKEGDVFKMFITIEGSGNLQNLIEPTLNLPKGFSVYGDPVLHENFNYDIYGASGEISYEYNIQATSKGNTAFPELDLVYFDPKKEEYVHLTAPELEIEVKGNKKFSQSNKVIVDASQNQDQEIATLDDSQDETSAIWSNKILWVGVSLPIIASLLFLFFKRKKKEEKIEPKVVSDEAPDYSAEEANKLSHEELVEAKKLIHSDSELFYNHIMNGILQHFRGAMNLESLPNRNTIKSHLATHPKKMEQFNAIASECDQARFGIGLSSESRESLYAQTIELIS